MKKTQKKYLDIKKARFARGIEAEPPAKVRSTKAGDGAHSPTRAAKGGEAARPKSYVIVEKSAAKSMPT